MADKNSEAAKLSSYISAVLGSAIGGGVPIAGLDFGPARKPGSNWVVTPNNNPQRPNPVENIGQAVKLSEQMASTPMDFDAGVVYIAGPAQNNAGLVRTPENLESFLRQSEAEHRDALEQFADNPNIPPDKALKLGIRAEEGLPKWWNDKEPRRPVTPTSSAVKKVRLGPNGDIYVTFGSSNKEYQYEGSSDPVKASEILRDLVAAESIGRAVNSWTGDWGRAHTYLPKG